MNAARGGRVNQIDDSRFISRSICLPQSAGPIFQRNVGPPTAEARVREILPRVTSSATGCPPSRPPRAERARNFKARADHRAPAPRRVYRRLWHLEIEYFRRAEIPRPMHNPGTASELNAEADFNLGDPRERYRFRLTSRSQRFDLSIAGKYRAHAPRTGTPRCRNLSQANSV